MLQLLCTNFTIYVDGDGLFPFVSSAHAFLILNANYVKERAVNFHFMQHMNLCHFLNNNLLRNFRHSQLVATNPVHSQS